MEFVITYDIPDDAIRRRIRRTLEGYGAWRQYSVFEVDLTRGEYESLSETLASQLDEHEGRVRLYRICESCDPSTDTIGDDPPETKPNVV